MVLVDDKVNYIEEINNARYKIAELKSKKIKARSKAWEDATGIAKEKEDYVRSVVADYDKEIAENEADIEWYYNMISVVNYKLENSDE